jgi:5-hydroxyisourate hydrolase
MALLSTHVLDTSRGVPAPGVKIDLYDSERTLLKSMLTNADGRVGESVELAPGVYELVFHAGDYFRSDETPPFLGEIVVRFGVSDPVGKYHVPLLLSPFGYSVYRGS